MSGDDDHESTDTPVVSEDADDAKGSSTVKARRITPLGGNAGVYVHSDPEPEDGDIGPEIDFGGFIVGLGTSCMIDLGEQRHPETGQRNLDIPSAEEIIAILEMLKGKTRGNLGREEEQLLEALLRDLKSAYHKATG